MDHEEEEVNPLVRAVAYAALIVAVFIIAFAFGWTVADAFGQTRGGEDSGRRYWTVSIAQLPTNKHTHVEVSGVVGLVKHEADGDTHIRLEDGKGHFVVCECIPKLPCDVPKKGEAVTVDGISRVDGVHKWNEVHPVEKLFRINK